MSILSIQSHVAYGYVGNKAAVYPLQNMGYDVWPVNTVQFSNHTGYGKWQGEIFSKDHIKKIIDGLIDLGIAPQCQAILSGYMGSADICSEVQDTVKKFKALNPHLIYLCDPVIGNTSCFVKPEVLDFFKSHLTADIITPNQFEAEILSGIKINNTQDLKKVAAHFHQRGIQIVVITGLKLADLDPEPLYVFAADQQRAYLVKTPEHDFPVPLNGTGDLFSAIYLGHYLKTRKIEEALQKAVYFTEKVVKATLDNQRRELEVTKICYDVAMSSDLPRIINL